MPFSALRKDHLRILRRVEKDLRVRDVTDTGLAMKRVCVDGPVFDAKRCITAVELVRSSPSGGLREWSEIAAADALGPRSAPY